jgi:hypothetical protein
MKKVTGRTVKISALTPTMRKQMFAIMNDYYAGMAEDSFQKDLDGKNHVILMETKTELVGFSTVRCTEMTVEGRKVIGVFSGDTILKQEYWGSSALGNCFIGYLWMLKLKNPLTPVYWFLISKGYKTYLLMANNFPASYPRPEKQTPLFESALRDHYYSENFGTQYDAKTGVITFNTEDKCRLKQFVAPITSDMRERYPRLQFFEKVNPGWATGLELACIARFDILTAIFLPIGYTFKKVICAKFMKAKKSAPKTQVPLTLPSFVPQGNARIVLAQGPLKRVNKTESGANLGV